MTTPLLFGEPLDGWSPPKGHTLLTIRRVRDPWGLLGNMSPHAIKVGDRVWNTAEALFQSRRFPEDHPIVLQLWLATSPMAAKMLAKKHASDMVVQPRSEDDLVLMWHVLKTKMDQHADVAAAVNMLRYLGTSAVEDCSARASESGLFWGAKLEHGRWWGHNALGRMWKQIACQVAAP